MSDAHRGAEAFLEGWVPEFGRSLEALEGEPPKLDWSLLTPESREEALKPSEPVLWWKQPFEAGKPFSVWVGTPARTWSDLTAGTGKSSEDRRQRYAEILGQSLQGAAQALRSTGGEPIVCKHGDEQEDTPPVSLQLASLNVALHDRQLAPILIGLEPNVEQVLEPAPSVRERKPEQQRQPFFEQLIGMDLPVSINLGRAVLPIKDILKLTSGSLIALNRQVGDPVDIVVHNVVVARGEVVSVNGNYGIRVQEVVSRQDRMALQSLSKASPTSGRA